ncbi:hypothetical protein HHK36_018766 [Tetracentron sinense]|uniref:Uncharacterized protein n=1 Tax=Tetracentron sinense TaxID=13715 RepID=A0A834YWH0_TETSI|nr:hypothetical protein HHK36_018766 [Tetracentron sinense]
MKNIFPSQPLRFITRPPVLESPSHHSPSHSHRLTLTTASISPARPVGPRLLNVNAAIISPTTSIEHAFAPNDFSTIAQSTYTWNPACLLDPPKPNQSASLSIISFNFRPLPHFPIAAGLIAVFCRRFELAAGHSNLSNSQILVVAAGVSWKVYCW